MKYELSNAAQRDLENIWLYTYENWSAEQADRYYNLLIDEIEFIAVKPHAGKDQGHIRDGYFRTRVKSHYIFYRINPRKKLVEIVRILHQRMDTAARLSD
ncbi:MAG: type II toxin-antitoxin system RelE/ParE family toxin [Pyrinomonadaceae bacterium]|nr:type II toxin-antitoxin system RelE/ParE family toxin [Pyrinomonadaceae bacterium]